MLRKYTRPTSQCFHCVVFPFIGFTDVTDPEGVKKKINGQTIKTHPDIKWQVWQHAESQHAAVSLASMSESRA